MGYEESEYLDLEPLKFFVRQIRREKRGGCAFQDGVVCAPLPVRILPKSKLGDELIVEFLDQKFGMHVPVFRLCEAIFRDCGPSGMRGGSAKMVTSSAIGALSAWGRVTRPMPRTSILPAIVAGDLACSTPSRRVQMV